MIYSQQYMTAKAQSLDSAMDVLSALVTDSLNKGLVINGQLQMAYNHQGWNVVQPMLKTTYEKGDLDEGPG